MENNNRKKYDQLEMPSGTAVAKLKKSIMFQLIQETGKDICFQCGKKIEIVDDLSIEHKIPWLDSENPSKLFFDLDNIAFSHLNCNISAARKSTGALVGHGTATMYRRGCRCESCRMSANADRNKYSRKKYGE